MTWGDVGSWIKDHSGGLLGLVGSIASGNIPGGVAAAASLIGQATDTDDPAKALEKLQTDPATLVKLKELAQKNEESIREHHRAMLELQLTDQQKEQEEQQKTIRAGDIASDEYVRHTRPNMARQSWYATMLYVIGMEVLKGFAMVSSGASVELAAALASPALAYMGFRTWDKIKGAASKVV